MDVFVQDSLHEFRRYKRLAENALVQLSDDEFFRRPAAHVNSPAIIVKHLAGNLRSRWMDFLTTDGEKSDRNRDGEFEIAGHESRERLMAAWDEGWAALLNSLGELRGNGLARPVTIRGEEHSVQQAMLRALNHVAYHVGQILYLVRWMRPDAEWLTVPPGDSRNVPGSYRKS
jgi:uncharacterized damage-inducible protein DinB